VTPLRSDPPQNSYARARPIDGDMSTGQLRQQLADFEVRRGIQIQLKIKFTRRLRCYLRSINHDFSPREFRL
jgi:hypothetical protein